MKKQLIRFVFCVGTFVGYAQDKEEIKKEDVLVEFSFNPTLSDVFKLKTTPTQIDSFPKKETVYKIKSKGVASDFVPTPKKVSYVDVDESKQKNYTNYVYGGIGLYGNAEVELLLAPKKIKGYQYGIEMSSYNAQNGVKDKRVDNGQWKTNWGLFLAKNNEKSVWRAEANYENTQAHWYGLDANILLDTYKNKGVKRFCNAFTFLGEIDYKEGNVRKLKPSIQFFSDNYNSSETNLKVGAVLDSKLFKDYITATVDFQYLSGGFDQNYAGTDNINYSFLNWGITPSYTYKSKGFQFTLDMGLFLNSEKEAAITRFLILPKLQADVVVLKDIMNLHAGLRSEIDQNSYASLMADNPFVSPTLNIKTTRTPADMFFGLDGSLTKSIRYATELSFKRVEDQVLFVHNNSKVNVGTNTVDQSYYMGNSFGVVYDHVKVLSLKGNIEVDLFEELSLGAKARFRKYNPDNQLKAWNLPGFELESFANYHKNQWFGQAGVNFINNRYDMVNTQAKKLDGFVDINLKSGYIINKQLNVHLNIYNLLSNKYQIYTNYEVQGFQALAGISYKF